MKHQYNASPSPGKAASSVLLSEPRILHFLSDAQIPTPTFYSSRLASLREMAQHLEGPHCDRESQTGFDSRPMRCPEARRLSTLRLNEMVKVLVVIITLIIIWGWADSVSIF